MYVNPMSPIQQLKKEFKSKVDVYDRKVETISGMWFKRRDQCKQQQESLYDDPE
jgi:hypothetical protein